MSQSESPQMDVYSIVTNRIIELLEAGTIPWRKPWTEAGLPVNLISKRPYRGINIMLLNTLGYDQNLFLTWKQLKTVNGSVKKGEKGHWVVFTKVTEAEKGANGQVVSEKKSILRYYKVFNISQCTDIPEAFIPIKMGRNNEPLEQCASIVEHMPDPPKIVHKKKGVFYVPSEDIINMPKLSSFESSEGYYGSLFHELIHSTGHSKRLNRKEVAENPTFGTEMYSMEELVAEIGSCYLKSHSGIPVLEIDNSAAYIKGWLEVFRGDKRFVIRAASRAQQAVDFILQSEKES